MPLFQKRPRKVNVEIRNYETELPHIPWHRRHPVLTVVIISAVILSLVVGGFVMFFRRSNPVSCFYSAAAQTFDAGCAFDTTAAFNGAEVMHYNGAMTMDRGAQSLRIALDAEVTDYSYRNVVYTDGKTSYLGNYYKGQWTVQDCSSRVLDFFDFYTDFRRHSFDAGSYLRFVDKTSEYNADELKAAVEKLLSKFANANDLTNLKVKSEDGATRYTYSLDIAAITTYLHDEGGPIFFSAEAFAAFRDKAEYNADTLSDAQVRLWFVVNDDGYMTECGMVIASNGQNYQLNTVFSEFGTAVPDIDEGFYSAASIDPPAA